MTRNIRLWAVGTAVLLMLVLAGANDMANTANAQAPGSPSASASGAAGQAQAAKIAPALQQRFSQQQQGAHLKYWVILKDQANTANNIPNSKWADKGWYVYNTLVNKAHSTQAPLLAQLGTMQTADKVSRTESFWIINSIAVEGDLASAQAMAASVDVAQVTELPALAMANAPATLSAKGQAVVNQALAQAKADTNKGRSAQGAQTNPFSPLYVQPNIS